MASESKLGLGLVQKYSVLQTELAGLVQYIDDTRNMLGGLHSELPAASDALAEVTKTTETAAHNMIDLVEQIMAQDEAATEALSKVEAVVKAVGDESALEAVKKVESLSNDRTDLLIRMMTELSFQDLTCQTINRIATTILEVERRVLALVDAGNQTEAREIDDRGMKRTAGVSRLRENQSGESRQDMVDELLRAREAGPSTPMAG